MRVCFVAENAYPAIAENSGAAFGGMETQAWAFAKSLSQRNCCEVSFAVSSPEHFDVRMHDGVQVFNRRAFIEHVRRDVARHCEIRHTWPLLQLRKWKRSLLWQIPLLAISRPFRASDSELRSIERFYRSLSTDVVVAYGVSSLSTSILEAAQAAGKRTVLSCASNDDLRSEYQSGSDYITAYGDRADVLSRGFRVADRIFVQTEWQKELARQNLKLSTEVVPNPVDDRWLLWAKDRNRLLRELLACYPVLREKFVLWTGRSEQFHKRPEMAYEVARRLPQIQFVMVMNVTSHEYGAELERICPQNVLLLPPQSHPEFVALMSLATAFLSTGSRQYEGFPNVFLQAGMLGVPVVSADCDFGVLSETGIGRSFEDSVPDMSEFLQMICTQPEIRQQLTSGVSERTRRMFGSDTVSARLWDLLSHMDVAV